MNTGLKFEIAPFEWSAGVRGEREIPAFDAEEGDLETGEEFERRPQPSVRARGAAPASRRFAAPSRSKPVAPGPFRPGGYKMRPPMQPPRPKPRPRPSRPGSWGPSGVRVRDSYSLVREPFPVDSMGSAPGTEIIRWAQDCLNHVMGLRLAVNGVTGVDMRSALRRFQGQQGLRVSGILGPDTEEALRSACGSDEAAAQAEAEFYVGEEAEAGIPDINSPKFTPFKDNVVNGIRRITNEYPNRIDTNPYTWYENLSDLELNRLRGKGGLYLLVFKKNGKTRAYNGMTFNFVERLTKHKGKMKKGQVCDVYIYPLKVVNKLRALEKAVNMTLGVRRPDSVLTNKNLELEEEELLDSEWN